MMQIKYIVFLPLVCMALLVSCGKNTVISDNQEQEFVKFYGGSPVDMATSVIECSAGGYALTGTMLSATNDQQAFFMRTDKYGNELEKYPLLFGGALKDQGNRIFETTSGDFVIIGTTQVNSTQTDVLVAKISASGDLLWMKNYGGAANEEGDFGIQTSDGNYVFGGYTESWGKGMKDALLYKISENGDSLWASYFGGTGDDYGNDVAEINGNLVLAGSTKSFQYDTKKSDIFLASISGSGGSAIDFETYGDAGNQSDVRLIKDADNLLILGQSSPVNSSLVNIYMLKVKDNYHQKIWEQTYASNNAENPADLVVDANRLVVAGTNYNNQNSNIFMRFAGTDGGTVSENIISLRGNQTANACILCSDGNLLIAGSNTIGGYSKIMLYKLGL